MGHLVISHLERSPITMASDRENLLSRLEEEHEKIEEAMEDLMIFPSKKIFQRSLKIIQSLFTVEGAVMKQCYLTEEEYGSQIQDQERIMAMARKALEGSPS